MQRFLVPCRLIKIFLMLRSLFFLVQVFKPGIFKLIQGQILRELTPDLRNPGTSPMSMEPESVPSTSLTPPACSSLSNSWFNVK
jgi:hypothetical protein